MEYEEFKKRVMDIRAYASGKISLAVAIEKLYNDISIPVEKRVSPKVADTIEMPSRINLFNACTDRCDMLQGHCACGAYHKLSDWKIEKIQ